MSTCSVCGRGIPQQTLLAETVRHWPDSSDAATTRFYEIRAGGYRIVISDTMNSTYDVAEHDDPDDVVDLAYGAIRTWYGTTDSVDDTPQARALAAACEEAGIW
jgi:hypothetical protein